MSNFYQIIVHYFLKTYTMITTRTKGRIVLKPIDKNFHKRALMTTESEAEPARKVLKIDSKKGQFVFCFHICIMFYN